MLFEKRLLFVGTSTGSIVVMRRRVDSQGIEQIDSKPMILVGHTGLIRCLLLVRGEGLGQDNYLLFSGGADRTVRMWDPAAGRDGSKQCVQTLRGHGGTVTSIAYSDGVLVTSSTDNSIKVWRQDDGRELLLYPWFSPNQTLGDLDCWVNDIALSVGEAAALYVGDEQGGLSAYRVEKSPPTATRAGVHTLVPWRHKPKAHALGIEKLMLVVSESFLITCAYDNTTKLWDTASGAAVFTIENERKCRFTALAWDYANTELVLGDDLGYIHFWNIPAERYVKSERVNADAERSNSTIKSVSTAAGEVVVSSAAQCGAWLVVRDVKYSEIKGHEGAVVSLCVADGGGSAGARAAKGGGGGGGAPAPASSLMDGALSGGGAGEAPLIYSAALDNTIRAYDPYDMSTLSVLREEKSEISTMFISPLSDFIITGNDDGSIRMWNPDSGSTISLHAHTNTVTSLDIAQRGTMEVLLSAGFDAHVGVWDVTKRRNQMPRLEHIFAAHSQEILCLRANPLNDTFITAGNDAKIHVYALSNFARLAVLDGHAEPVTCLALDGNFLLSGSEDGGVRVWDMHSFMALGALQIHHAPVESMLVVPENGLLVTCSTDSTVRVWDYGRGEQIQVWRHPEEFRCVALRRTTGHVLAGTEQCNIIAFPLSECIEARERMRKHREEEAGEDAARGL